MQDEVTMFADPNDRASQETDMTLELRNRDSERKLIKKIDETLRNIDGDEYGYCEGCGIEIGLKRLESAPYCYTLYRPVKHWMKCASDK